MEALITPPIVGRRMDRIAVINGSIAGEAGSTAAVLSRLSTYFSPTFGVDEIVLKSDADYDKHIRTITAAKGIIIGTGTYWDTWGSPLQAFLEAVTETEGGSAWLGKPLSVIVTMHSVGGKGVLSRLQGVMNTFGCSIPPMSGLLYSQVSHRLLQVDEIGEMADDMWSLDDLEIVAHNLAVAVKGGGEYRSWPVDLSKFRERWLD